MVLSSRANGYNLCLLVSFHSYLPDCSVLLRAALVVLASSTYRGLRWLSALLLTPAAYFLLLADSPAAASIPLAILLLVLWMSIEAGRRPARRALSPQPG